MATERFEVAVIGLGPIGAGALRHLAAAGVRGVGVGSAEPADLATHDGVFASHYDSGRVTRHIDPTFEWAELARRAIADYAIVEQRAGWAFHRPVGIVYGVDAPDEVVALRQVAVALGRQGVAVAECRGDEIADGRVALGAGLTVFVEGPPAGHVDPRRMVAAQQAVARLDGATVIDARVSAAVPVAGGWQVRLADGTALEAERVVLAAGPHADEIAGLPPMPPLWVRAETIVTGVIGAAECQRLAGLGCVLAPLDDPVFADGYLVPPTDYPDGTIRLKLGAGRSVPRALGTGASRRAWMRGTAHLDDLAALRGFAEAWLPGLEVERWETRPCLITDTPTGLPYVDHLADGLVLAGGCNGYAAKSGDAIGAVAASLVREGRWTDALLDAKRFSAEHSVVALRSPHGVHVH